MSPVPLTAVGEGAAEALATTCAQRRALLLPLPIPIAWLPLLLLLLPPRATVATTRREEEEEEALLPLMVLLPARRVTDSWGAKRRRAAHAPAGCSLANMLKLLT